MNAARAALLFLFAGWLLCGCAARQPKAPLVVFLNAPRLECDGRGDCETVQDWVTADGRQIYSPAGCVLKKIGIEWLVWDHSSVCPWGRKIVFAQTAVEQKKEKKP